MADSGQPRSMLPADFSAAALTPPQRARRERFGGRRSVDVHCHLLPGIDDGPPDMAEALRLAAALAADGITSVVASPHQLGQYDGDNLAVDVRRAIDELARRLAEAGVALELMPGGDVRIDERLFRKLDEGDIETIGGLGRHLLLELPFACYVDPTPVIKGLLERGVQPIMTHPERHRYLLGRVERIAAWRELGAAVQVTAGSLLGDFGRSAEMMAWELVDRGLADLLATDAHDSQQRPPRLTAALAAVEEEAGAELARRIAIDNPEHVWTGQTIPLPPGASV